ncbi:MAG: EAL domain-containing protein [Gallionellaceae bacterium]
MITPNNYSPLVDLSASEFASLLLLGEQLTAELDLNNVLNRVAEMARQVIDAETLSVPIVDENGETFTYRAVCGKYAEMLQGQSFPILEGACGWVINHQRPLLFGDGGTFEMAIEASWAPGKASTLLVPLVCRGKIIGGLSAMGKLGDQPFNMRDQTVLTLFANQASIAIDNAQLFQKLGFEESRLRLVLDSASEGIFGVNVGGTCTFANPSCLQLLGYAKADELIGKSIHELIHHTYSDGRPYPFKECCVHLSTQIKEEIHIDNEVLWRANGSSFPAEYWARPICRDGQLDGAVVTFIDITQRRQQEERIWNLAYFDPLTELPNRRLLMDRLGQALIASTRTKEFGALIILDLDNFKTINDTQGHDVGDQLLIGVSQRLLECVRQEDTVSRLGGDEYVVMLENIGANVLAASKQAETIAEKIRLALALPHSLSESCKLHHSSCSIGVALFQGQAEGIDTLFKQADVALYQSKAAGRNTIRFFNPDMQRAIDLHSSTEAALRMALENEEFRLFYQPQVDLQGNLTGTEALIRWFSKEQKPISPAQFIPVAEDTGLIIPIGVWVMQTACKQLHAWAKNPLTQHLQIAINVSAKQFRQTDFVKQIQEVLTHTDASPALLKIELTESVLLENVDEVIDRILQIKALGVTFSLDDFGTGFSSLSYLKRLPLDQVKIDQSFVRDVNIDPNDAAIVRAIIAMSQSLGLKVIAEGVETEDQLNFLKDNGCEHFQGYFFGKPMPIEEWPMQK